MQADIYRILPFDSSVGTTIKFSWNGNQIFKNRCIIKNNETNETVYDNTIESFKMEHPIDLSKLLAPLQNGTKYHAFITVFDHDGRESDLQSLGTTFLCLKNPEFVFDNLSDSGQVINSSSYNFSLSYEQENGELLNSWSISVYSRDGNLLSSSGIRYTAENLSHMFSGFNNYTEYYIRGTGQTVNGMELDTGLIGISVVYDIYGIFTLLELTNIKKDGAIHIKSNIISAVGSFDQEPGVYTDDGCLDLKSSKVTYSEGFSFDGDYSFVTLFYGMQPNQEVIDLHADDPEELHCTVTYRIGRLGSDELCGCFELKVVSNGITSVYYSNKIPLPGETDRMGIIIYRSGGRYSIEVSNLGGDD